MMRIICCVFICLVITRPASAQDGLNHLVPLAPEVITRNDKGEVTVRAVRLDGSLTFDGRLDDRIYSNIPSFGDFIQQDPIEGGAATDKTEVWVFFDDANLYVGARLWETAPERRVANEMRRDSFNLYNNDHFAVGLDTFHDRRNGYGFFVNALGGLGDSQVINEQPNPNWSTLWDARTADFDGGWTVEIRIPFRSIRFKEGGDTWGINFRRLVRWNNESTFLAAVPQSWGRRGLAKVSSEATLIGLKTPAKQRNFDIKPYALGSLASNRLVTPTIDNHGNAEFGADAKWPISQSLVADLTYNTDFAQVEDDEAQVNLTRFSLFFPEKREFFLEGADYFAFGAAGGGGGGGGGGGQGGGGGGGGGGFNNPAPLLFYSRRIGLANGQAVPIVGGGRLLGRGRGFQFGALQMRTGDDVAAGAVASDFSVLRVNRDVFSRSRVGVIATRRSPGTGGAADNYAYGADVALNPHTDLSITGYWSKTDTPTADRRDISYRGGMNWNADRTGLQLEHLMVGDNFDPGIGFVRRSAFRRSYGQARFSPRPEMRGVRKLFFEGSLDYYETISGAVESRETQATLRAELTSSDQIGLELTDAFEYLAAPFAIAPGVTVPVGAYSFRQAKATWFMSASRRVSGFASISAGEFYGGTLRELSWRGRIEVSPQLSVEPQFSLNHVDTPFGTGDTNVVGSRATYTLTPRMFVGALLQYQSATKSVSANLRFRWEYQPGSELFVVYSDLRDTDDFGFPPRMLSRSLVVKLTKLFRL